MRNERNKYHSDIIEEFCGGAWYKPKGQDKLQRVRPLLLSTYSTTLFAALATTLVRFLGGA